MNAIDMNAVDMNAVDMNATATADAALSEFAGWTSKSLYPSDKWWRSLGIPFFAGVMMPHFMVFLAGILLFCFAAPESTQHGLAIPPASVQIH